VFNRHCEERSDEAIQLRAKRAKQKSAAVAVTAVVIWRACRRAAGLLRCARNDALKRVSCLTIDLKAGEP
jgi:hypothetical protein